MPEVNSQSGFLFPFEIYLPVGSLTVKTGMHVATDMKPHPF
jgi:hypothetical protein